MKGGQEQGLGAGAGRADTDHISKDGALKGSEEDGIWRGVEFRMLFGFVVLRRVHKAYLTVRWRTC